jgi:hypothetical protein
MTRASAKCGGEVHMAADTAARAASSIEPADHPVDETFDVAPSLLT